jgi:hypothetical protein
MDVDMLHDMCAQHGHPHAAWSWACSINMDTQHEQGHGYGHGHGHEKDMDTDYYWTTTWFLGFAEKRKLAEVLAKVTEVNES